MKAFFIKFDSMESNIIYSASSHMKAKVNWNVWIFCDVGSDIKKDVIVKAINEHFGNEKLVFVNTRKNSSELSKEYILERIENELEKHEIFIWDIYFNKVVELNKIGVLRNGIVQLPK